jgi:hypothetical protein
MPFVGKAWWTEQDKHACWSFTAKVRRDARPSSVSSAILCVVCGEAWLEVKRFAGFSGSMAE